MPKILIAEDERDIRDLMVLTFQFYGYEAVGVRDGIEVLEAAEREKFDVMLLDVRMPRMTGYEACRILKQNDATKNIPVIFLSAKGQETEIQTGLKAGASSYLLKPFAPDTVIQAVNQAIMDAEIIHMLKNFSERDIEQLEPSLIASNVRWLFLQYKWALNSIETLKNKLNSLQKENKRLLWQLKNASERRSPASRKEGSARPLSLSEIQRLNFEEISKITDGIVHDMRNGLGVIHNTLGFLKDDLQDDSHQADIDKISSSLKFCELVLRNLSALGGRDVFNPQSINLEETVREVYSMLQQRLIDVDLVVEADPEASTIVADEGHIKQIFMNLIKNAGEAMPEGGTITFKTKGYRDKTADTKMVQVEISDTGIGISQKNRQRLLDGEVFSTKETGVGLGLYIVQTIMKRHRGHLEVKSTNNKGTTFILHFPVEG